jgi:hypothetical protein
VAEIQIRLRLVVLPPFIWGNIFIIPEVVDLMDSQWAEVNEEQAALDIDLADPVEFNPTQSLVCRAVRSGSCWARDPGRIRGARIGVVTVLVIARHIAVP